MIKIPRRILNSERKWFKASTYKGNELFLSFSLERRATGTSIEQSVDSFLKNLGFSEIQSQTYYKTKRNTFKTLFNEWYLDLTKKTFQKQIYSSLKKSENILPSELQTFMYENRGTIASSRFDV